MSKSVFIDCCIQKEAFSEEERAALVGRDRHTVRRWLKGKTQPSLPDARIVALVLGTTVDELWPQS